MIAELIAVAAVSVSLTGTGSQTYEIGEPIATIVEISNSSRTTQRIVSRGAAIGPCLLTARFGDGTTPEVFLNSLPKPDLYAVELESESDGRLVLDLGSVFVIDREGPLEVLLEGPNCTGKVSINLRASGFEASWREVWSSRRAFRHINARAVKLAVGKEPGSKSSQYWNCLEWKGKIIDGDSFPELEDAYLKDCQLGRKDLELLRPQLGSKSKADAALRREPLQTSSVADEFAALQLEGESFRTMVSWYCPSRIEWCEEKARELGIDLRYER